MGSGAGHLIPVLSLSFTQPRQYGTLHTHQALIQARASAALAADALRGDGTKKKVRV